MRQPKSTTHIIAVIRRARKRGGYNPLLRTSVSARLIDISPRQLRRHCALAVKIERRWYWRWTAIEQILTGSVR
jgi:hypothetical protein